MHKALLFKAANGIVCTYSLKTNYFFTMDTWEKLYKTCSLFLDMFLKETKKGRRVYL